MYQIKCATLRAFMQVLERQGRLVQVRACLPSAEQAQLERLPLPSSWVEGELLDQILEGVHDRDGEVVLRRVVHEATRQGVLPGLLPVVQTVFRIVGTSPAFLLERFGGIVRNNLRGVEFEYRPGQERSGEMTVRFADRRPLQPVWLKVQRINLVTLFEICNETGVVDAPELASDGISATYRVRW